MLKLSKKYAISDVGLRKICIGMEIPLPRAGHWMKLQAGKKVPQQKLPENYTGKTEVKLELREEGKEYYTGKHADVKKIKDDIVKNIGDVIQIPERLNTKEPLILAAKESLAKKNATWNYKGIIQTESNIIYIKVSESNAKRALIFMDCFIKTLRLRGHDIEVQFRETYAIIDKERVKICCREKCKAVKITDSRWDSRELHATGILSFKCGTYDAKEWVDGKKLIEEQIPDIIAKMELRIKELHKSQEETRIYFAKLKAEEDRIREIELNKERELQKFKDLLEESKRWEKVKVLRDYLNYIEQRGQKDKLSEEEFSKWLMWAKKKADWYDPMIESSDELLMNIDKESLSFKKNKSGIS
jgi:hypothetical protein